MQITTTHPLQFCTNDGIAARLLNAKLRRQKTREPRRTTPGTRWPQPTGNVLTDSIVLVTRELTQHVHTLLRTRPLQTVRDDAGHTRIRVCGALDYVLDHRRCRVWAQAAPLTAQEQRHWNCAVWTPDYDASCYSIDLLNPLSRPLWLESIACRPRWFKTPFQRGASTQQDLFADDDDLEAALRSITRAVFSQLQKDPQFHALRRQLACTLAQYLDAPLVDLAMRSRTSPHSATLNAVHLTNVWRNRRAFEVLERENPRLVTTFAAWLESGRGGLLNDELHPVSAMRNDLLENGFTPCAWRYLARHGPDCLISTVVGNLTWSDIRKGLGVLQIARWPKPPPRGFVRMMFDVAGVPDSFDHSTHGVPGWFWQWTCNAAHSSRHDTAAYKALFDSVGLWAWLVRMQKPEPDSNQRRKDIKWLAAWAITHSRLAVLDSAPSWFPWLCGNQLEALPLVHVVPLRSPHALLTEALALHNCADSYTSACQEGRSLLLSLRDPVNQRRVALMSMQLRDCSWRLDQLAGPCNRAVPAWVRQAALRVAIAVRQCYEVHLATTCNATDTTGCNAGESR